jgi:hypothetical protein
MEQSMKRVSAAGLSLALLWSSTAMAQNAAENAYEAKWVVSKGNGKGTKEVRAIMNIEDDSVVLRSNRGEVLKVLTFDSLNTVSHSTSRHHRWVSGLALGTFVNPVGYVVVLTRSKRHYVTFFDQEGSTVLQLKGDDLAPALAQIQRHLPRPIVQAAR